MTIHKYKKEYDWDGVPVLKYKEDGTHFKSITRRVLFGGNDNLPCEIRYFEIAAGGHSTLERHEHTHTVIIVRGKGEALVESKIITCNTFDVLEIAPLVWHQFRANKNETFGFFCIVNINRDKPTRPTTADIAAIAGNPEIASFIRT
jgi:quercetin dioxygenase-like cupin family protein